MTFCSLEGRVALVTGATGGIGRAVAERLVAQGAKVALAGRRMEVLHEIVGGLPEGSAAAFPGDFSQAEGLQDLVGGIEERWGKLDVLVNNAGITRDALAVRMNQEQWREVIHLNLTVPFLLAQEAFKGMTKRRYGRIINIASVVGSTGNIGQTNYAAAKAGLVGMMKSLALEGARRGVTVNTIAPGFIETPMTEVLPSEHKELLLKRIPLERMGNPAEISGAVAFLASDEAAYITGHTLHVNGGMYMA